MGWVQAALTVAGAVVEGMGAKAEADAQAKAAKYNARIAMIQANEVANSIRTQSRIIHGYNISRVQKSGVRLTGSPLAVLANNAFNADRAALNAIRTGEAQKKLYLMGAEAARTAGQYGIASAALRGAGSLAGGVSGNTFAGSGGGSPLYTGPAFTASPKDRYKLPSFNWTGGFGPGGS